MTQLKVGVIVEGHGDVDAIPVLIRRIAELHEIFDTVILRPFRVNRSRFNEKFDDFERALRYLSQNSHVIAVVLDADDDCPRDLCSNLRLRAREIVKHLPVSIVAANKEFEAWLLAAIESLRGRCGVRTDAVCPSNVEEIRGAKQRVEAMMDNRIYSETVDQVKLAANMDLRIARQNSRSFDKFVRDIKGVLGAR
ncbi:DUF4276 family protein [Mycobacterium angelicum]|uniref:DUF4276 domain-containing protein n=1 Tax=Mycobacterium angelicum TaxID=470074 RepID=A0A1W9Z9C8_MYCAN|nr:DUF4276 family protein [Mycobacterium angelicum]MCV7199839.1 DUF4276 family protein [Mycobacterium angelicum]ORA09765.1 hypothetical protein BST12_27340 [Mycobacterium angelicum]